MTLTIIGVVVAAWFAAEIRRGRTLLTSARSGLASSSREAPRAEQASGAERGTYQAPVVWSWPWAPARDPFPSRPVPGPCGPGATSTPHGAVPVPGSNRGSAFQAADDQPLPGTVGLQRGRR